MKGQERQGPRGSFQGDLRNYVQVTRDGQPFAVVAHNLSDEDVALKVHVNGEEGLTAERPEVTLAIPAGGEVRHGGRLITSNMKPGREYRLEWHGEAKGFRVSPTVIYFRLIDSQ